MEKEVFPNIKRQEDIDEFHQDLKNLFIEKQQTKTEFCKYLVQDLIGGMEGLASLDMINQLINILPKDKMPDHLKSQSALINMANAFHTGFMIGVAGMLRGNIISLEDLVGDHMTYKNEPLTPGHKQFLIEALPDIGKIYDFKPEPQPAANDGGVDSEGGHND